MRRFETVYHRVVVTLLFLILLLPLAATLVYALATQWGATILPQGFTLKWLVALWSDPRFLQALWHSLLICFGTLVLAVVVILPLMFVIAYYFPKLDAVMNVLILLPFAVPPVVSSVGLMQLFAADPLPLLGTPWILIGCYFTIALPFYLPRHQQQYAGNQPARSDGCRPSIGGQYLAGGVAGGAAKLAQRRDDRSVAVVLISDW